jgi:undecaprenyl-diphosphatase
MITTYFSLSFLLELVLESLPISSSGHLAFLSSLCTSIKPLSFIESHLSHALILLVQCFFLLSFLKTLLYRKKWILILKLMLLFISITVITTIGYVIKNYITHIIPSISIPLFLGFFITTAFLFSSYFINFARSRQYYQLSFKDSIFLGLFQCIAFLPGVSRLATMFLGAQLCQFTRNNALFIAIGSNAAISGISVLYLFYHHYTVEKILIPLSLAILQKLCIALILSASLFYLSIYLFRKNRLFYFIIYELIISLIAFYLS